MAKYILSKKAKGKKYQYTVTDEKGNVVSTRTSARDYVACTANGEITSGVNVGRIARKRNVTRLVMTGQISTNGEIANLEYMIKTRIWKA